MNTMVTPDMMADGHPMRFVEIRALDGAARRWIGRCKCGTSRKLEGTVVGARAASVTNDMCVDRAVLGFDGKLYTTRVYFEAGLVLARCSNLTCSRFVHVKLVTEGSKASKHTCGARCVNATGPMCDCKCRGANHGSNAPG